MKHLAPSGRIRPAPGIVHLGLGAFFRAHVAMYVDDAIAASGGDWGVIGVSLKSIGTHDKLTPQNGCYTAVEMAPEGLKSRQIEVVREVLVAPENPQAVLDAMASGTTHIVSLTVTEKGYCHLPATGALNPEHPDIVHDITAALPRSAPGFLVRAMALRRAAGLPPFTVLPCDNLPENGAVIARVVLDLASRIDPDLAAWIKAEGAFPSTMVDRIVPATTGTDLAKVAALTGVQDAAPVMHEPFRQWVIEDRFAGPRPDFAAAGAQMVSDVTPFEHMKLRMLNGSHSALAYFGQLLGHELICDAVNDPALAGFIEHIWQDEIIPSLTPPEGTDLHDYAAQLMERYRNPQIRHRTVQIAMDGSQKLPQRILETVQDGLDAGRDVSGLLAVVAAWIAYVERAKNLADPMAETLQNAVKEDGVAGVLALQEIFPAGLSKAIAPQVIELHDLLHADGVATLLARA